MFWTHWNHIEPAMNKQFNKKQLKGQGETIEEQGEGGQTIELQSFPWLASAHYLVPKPSLLSYWPLYQVITAKWFNATRSFVLYSKSQQNFSIFQVKKSYVLVRLLRKLSMAHLMSSQEVTLLHVHCILSHFRISSSTIHVAQKCKIKHLFNLWNFSKLQWWSNCKPYTCNSSSIIYLITCRKCHKQYVGLTTTSLKERLNHQASQHRLKDIVITRDIHG